jgi:putative two-component system response regulator
MSIPLIALLVGQDELLAASLRSRLEERYGVKLYDARCPAEAMESMDGIPPDLLLCIVEEESAELLGLCRWARNRPESREIPIVLIIDPEDIQTKRDALHLGVRQFLTNPVDPEEILDRLFMIRNLKRLRAQAGALKAEVDAHRKTDQHGSDRVVRALAHTLEMRVPGSIWRGGKVSELAAKIACRFGVPEPYMYSLEVAARLREIGRKPPTPGTTAPHWQYVLSSKSILNEIDGFREAADLVGDMYENWDGSGFPHHLISGQIPLRSRILRVAADLIDSVEGGNTAGQGEIAAHLAHHAGTHYDPTVIAYAQTILVESPSIAAGRKEIVVQIDELTPGMILAEDLITDSGLKLLSRGTVLTEAGLRAIGNRHASDPILKGATIRRRSEAA